MKANSQDSNIIIISDKSCNIVREDDNNSEKHGEIRIGEDGTDDSTNDDDEWNIRGESNSSDPA